MIFVGTEEVHYLKSDLISKINFVQTKEKRYNPKLLLPERRFMLAQSMLVNSKQTRSRSTLLAKMLAKTDVVRKTVSKREKMVEST